LIRPCEEGRWDRQAEGLGGLEIDDQLELRWLLDRKISWAGALQDPVHVTRGVSPKVGSVRAVRHQAAGVRILLRSEDGRQPVLLGECRNLAPVREHDGIDGRHNQRLCAFRRDRSERAVEVFDASQLDRLQLQMQRSGSTLRLLVIEHGSPDSGIPEDRDPRESGTQLLEQLQPLPAELWGHRAVASDVSAIEEWSPGRRADLENTDPG